VRTLLAFALWLCGCIDPFHGSNVQFDFSPAMPVQASPGATPGAGELPADVHFTFYAIEDDGDTSRMFAVQQFEIHRIVDLSSPCFIDVGAHVPFPGLHVSQYATMVEMANGIPDYTNPPPGATEAQKVAVATAVQRMQNIALLGGPMGIHVVSSASDANYPDVALDCTSPGIPPPTCTDNASNQRRLDACQTFWKANPGYFEGTDRVLTQPLNGTTHGMVDGHNPVDQGPVGGAQFFVNTDLGSITEYAVYYQLDGMPDPGTLLMYGTASEPTQGVIHVHLRDPLSSTVFADVAIFPNLDEGNTSF
jgi:hypothetical protein